MNIFVLDNDIEKCARYHCDQHVSKMILESVQILCTALNKRGFVTPYKSTHIYHPCTIWAGSSLDNFNWLTQLAFELNKEYRFRYDKREDHKSISVLNDIKGIEFAAAGLSDFAQAMPDKYKASDAVLAYRRFYVGEKLGFATWTKRSKPRWLNEKKYLLSEETEYA